MLSRIRQRLGWKIFLSYLLVIMAGILVLAASTEFSIPTAFERHMTAMMPMMQDGGMGMGMMGTGNDMGGDLFTSFRNAVNEALWRAALAAFAAALVVSWFVSRRVVMPVRAMMHASQHIAEGHYEERVRVPGDPLEGDELTELALSFNRMAAKLAQTEAMRRQLIADVSHELRTPLTTIKGWMEGLIDGVLPPTAETFQEVYREAERLGKLVDDLQELSRVEARAYALEPRPADLAPLVDAAIRRLTPQYREKGVALAHDCPAALPPVTVDADRFAQVLINLLGNALQYTPAGGTVRVTCTPVHKSPHTGVPDGDWLLVQVQDNGVGIAPEHLPHLFTRFYRVDKSRTRASGGSGIGLTIAKHIIEAHGGHIWAESDGPGKGSTFTIALPL
ncbi:MAG: ATP-binding protein [Anaerolineales bacterium]